MFKIKSLEMYNIGPFRKRQKIDFPERGLISLYGENTLGKTSIMNSLRFLLFGESSKNEEKYYKIFNHDSLLNGEEKAFVNIEIEDGEDRMNITRELILNNTKLNKIKKIKHIEELKNSDFKIKFFASKNGDILGPDELKRYVNNLIPKDVARFFLFDGEYLDDYKALVKDVEGMGRRIKVEIERILGVPILTTGIDNLQDLLDDKERKVAKLQMKNNKNKDLAKMKLEKMEEKKIIKNNLKNEIETRDKYKDQISEIENKLENHVETEKLIERKNRLIDEASKIKNNLAEANEDLKEKMKNTWWLVLKDQLNEKLKILENKEEELKNKINAVKENELIISLKNKIKENHICPVCAREIDINENPISIKNNKQEKKDLKAIEKELTTIKKTIENIKEYEENLDINNKDLEKAITDHNDLLVDFEATKKKLKDLDNKLKNTDIDTITELIEELSKITKKLNETETTITSLENELSEIETNITKIDDKIKKSGDQDENIKIMEDYCNTYRNLIEIFENALDVYRNNLKNKVENKASNLFLKLTHRTDEYEKLEMDDNFGLKVIDKKGQKVSIRSAGLEQIVAFALIGALQSNAPLKGPLFIDTPFGRLDKKHRKKVLETLPNMSEQVFLLVHSGEIGYEEMRSILKHNLSKEFELIVGKESHEIITFEREI